MIIKLECYKNLQDEEIVFKMHVGWAFQIFIGRF
jgi:hypothetical protein